MEEARKELERALEDAELAYRTGAIEYEQNLITAEYTRDSAILTGQQAKEVYDETVRPRSVIWNYTNVMLTESMQLLCQGN